MIYYKKINLLYLTYRKKYKQLTDEINSRLVPYNITAQHAVYIMALESNGNMTLKDLTDCVGNDGALTTRVIKKLDNFGYIEKVEERTKKYKIGLTKLGKNISKVILGAINKARKTYFANLTKSEVLCLFNIAEKLS